MKKKDREFLEADRTTRLLRITRLTAHFVAGGPLVERLPDGEDLPALRRKAARLRAGAIAPEDPSEDPRALSWKIDRAVEQHLLAETIAAEMETHNVLVEKLEQKSGHERELRKRATFHRLKVSPEANDPRSDASEKVRQMHRKRKKELGRSGQKRPETRLPLPRSPRLRVPLRFVVGNEQHVFFEPYASNLTRAFAWWFPFQIRHATDAADGGAWLSGEVEWYGWKELQYFASALLGPTVPHLRCTHGWRGVYLPVETEPQDLVYVGGDPWPLSIGALGNLIVELERFGRKCGLPLDDAELEQLPRQADPDELLAPAYAEVLRAAHHADRVRLPLWVVR